MTESEFAEAIRAAKEAGWDEGANVAWEASGEGFNGEFPDPGEPFDAEPNPYRERKMTPAEIEEWRRTCPYPEALGHSTLGFTGTSRIVDPMPIDGTTRVTDPEDLGK